MPPKIDRLTISLVMITVLLLLAIFVGPLLWIYVNSVFFGKQEILNVAKSITTNKNDPTSLLEAIADWEKENMVYNTRSVYFYPILPLLMWRISHPNPA